jgi:hypothetical protein
VKKANGATSELPCVVEIAKPLAELFGETMETAVITSVRNDQIFLKKWIEYYGANFGRRNLFVFMDGHDQQKPENCEDVTFLWLPHRPLARVPAMRRRARAISNLAIALHRFMDCVIATDVDEFLLPDPSDFESLRDFIDSQPKGLTSWSGLGLDVAQNLRIENPIDLSKPFLGQRRFAHLSARYTKPVVSFRPVTWGSGMHRIKGRNFHIHPSLYHFHFGMVDYALSTGKTADKDRLQTGWGGHLQRREKVFDIVSNSQPKISADVAFAKARWRQTWIRPIFALNKPAMLRDEPVVEIPSRFFGKL